MNYALILYFMLFNADGTPHSSPQSVAHFKTSETCEAALHSFQQAALESNGRAKVIGSCSYDPDQKIVASWI